MTTITLTQEQAAALARGESITISPPKPEAWEPNLSDAGRITIGIPRGMNYGQWQSTIDSYNRLLAYVYEFGGDWEADWEDVNQAKGFVYYDTVIKEYETTTTQMYKNACTVYMSEECAEGLRAKLNSGEVVL